MNQLLLLFGLLLAAGASWAQASPTDILLLTNGEEVAGRVLTITPLQLSYLPVAGADTLRLAAADVFLVRYANGTREVLHPTDQPEPAGQPDLLAGLSNAQRYTLAQRDVARSYTGRGAFWGSLGATLYGGPLLGMIAPAVIAPNTIGRPQLKAPHPELLNDPVYGDAYRREAQRRKRGQAWGGYGLGAAIWVILLGAALSTGP